ncbi:hypothetical protein TrST_g9530 [Triparma strigata]|uniref:Tudor domain-containing protein n=1 Tax=Triparma strigata TaxID=1606541 RepID=A0A9W7A3M2_9STRA|nr:hypothetical protein TrST_g9530 [Triparma strigata]
MATASLPSTSSSSSQPPSSYNCNGAPFTLCISSSTTKSFHPLSCPLLIGRKPKVVPLQTTTIHVPPTYDGVSRKHLQIIRICANKVKVKLCSNAVNTCLVIKRKTKEKVTVDKIETVDFEVGDTLILDRYNGKEANLMCKLIKNENLGNSGATGEVTDEGGKESSDSISCSNGSNSRTKMDIEKEYTCLPNRGDRVKIEYRVLCNYPIETHQMNYFFGVVKSKRKAVTKPMVAVYKIGFDDGTEDVVEYPGTNIERVEGGDIMEVGEGVEVGMLCEGRYQDERKWYRGRIAGVNEEGGERCVDVVYIDGDGEKNVPFENVRLIKEVAEWLEKDADGKFQIDGREVSRAEKVTERMGKARDACEREGRFNFFPEQVVQSPSKKRKTPKKRKPRKPTQKEIKDGQTRTNSEQVMDDGHVFPVGSLESKIREYRLRLARSDALKKLEHDNGKLLTQDSTASTVVASSQATLESGGDDARDVSFKAEGNAETEGEGVKARAFVEQKDRPVVKEMPLSLFQPLLQGVQSSDPLEAYNYLVAATSTNAPPFVSKSINIFDIIKDCKDVRRVTFLCNYVLMGERRYESFRIANTGGSIFSWDDFLMGICRPREVAARIFGKAAMDVEGKEVGGEEEMECAAVVVSCVGKFIRGDVEGGGLAREQARGRPISIFWSRGIRESLKSVVAVVVDSHGKLSGHSKLKFETAECNSWLAKILCLVFRIYEESGENDGAFIVKDEVIKLKAVKDRTKFCKLLDEDVREKVVMKLGSKVGKMP